MRVAAARGVIRTVASHAMKMRPTEGQDAEVVECAFSWHGIKTDERREIVDLFQDQLKNIPETAYGPPRTTEARKRYWVTLHVAKDKIVKLLHKIQLPDPHSDSGGLNQDAEKVESLCVQLGFTRPKQITRLTALTDFRLLTYRTPQNVPGWKLIDNGTSQAQGALREMVSEFLQYGKKIFPNKSTGGEKDLCDLFSCLNQELRSYCSDKVWQWCPQKESFDTEGCQLRWAF